MKYSQSSVRRSAEQGGRSFAARPEFGRTEPGSWLLTAVDLGLAGLIVLVPFTMGGRQAHGQLLLVALALWTTLSWAAYQLRQQRGTWIWSRAEGLLVAAIALVVLQTATLPASLIESLSPRHAELLPAWKPPTEGEWSPGPWRHLSLTPWESRDGLVVLFAYALIFLVTVQRVRSRGDAERLLRIIAASCVGMAVFGLVQYFTSNGKFFWFYRHPFTDTLTVAKGSFTNRNHFAHFLALGLGPLICWLLTAMRQNSGAVRRSSLSTGTARTPLTAFLLVGLAIVLLAGLLSLSRGGAVAMAVAALVCLLALFRVALLSGRFLFGLAGLAVLLAGLLLAVDEQKIQGRLDDLFSGNIEQLDQDSGRRAIWSALLVGISDFPFLGTGVGSHREVYPIYLDEVDDGFEYTHAENGYLQVALETGLVGLGLMLIGFAWCVSWCWRGLRRDAEPGTAMCLAGISGSVAASLVHSLGDFVWYVPGCMAVLIIQAACACRLWQISAVSKGRPEPATAVPWLGWAVSIPMLAILGFWMIQTKLPPLAAESHWHAYVRLVKQPEADESSSADQLRDELIELAAAVKANPEDARLQRRMATGYLKLFNFLQAHSENAMSLEEIRDAAWASQFESQAQLDEWLGRVLGENRKYLESALAHARQAIALCPLQGSAYLLLADLLFIEHYPSAVETKCLEQALAVRPYDSHVLFAVGRQALFAGDTERAMEFWRGAFARSPAYQERIVQMLAGSISATEFIENFQPNWSGLVLLCQHFRAQGLTEDLDTALRHLAIASVRRAQGHDGPIALEGWLTAFSAFQELDRPDLARRCLEGAYKADPSSLGVRLRLGEWLFHHKEYAAAAEHLAWCAAREPGNADMQRMAELALKESLRNQTARR